MPRLALAVSELSITPGFPEGKLGMELESYFRNDGVCEAAAKSLR